MIAREALLLVLIAACAHTVSRGPQLPYAFEARPTGGEVRVVPVFSLYAPPSPELSTYLGPPLPAGSDTLRYARARELAGLADQVGRVLPGEVNAELGEAWPGQFRSHRLAPGWRSRVESALRGDRDLDATLSEAAHATGGDAVLFSWVDELDVLPLALLDLEGTTLLTQAGPVVVDDQDEPYLVAAAVGMALVTHDGEVVVRYRDTFNTVLSQARGPDTAARDLAHGLAEEVALMWATDPRLLQGEPSVVGRAD